MQVNQPVKIISDSTCDLSQELVEKYDIDILPLHILCRVLRRKGYLAGQYIYMGRRKQSHAENLGAFLGGCRNAAAPLCCGGS